MDGGEDEGEGEGEDEGEGAGAGAGAGAGEGEVQPGSRRCPVQWPLLQWRDLAWGIYGADLHSLDP